MMDGALNLIDDQDIWTNHRFVIFDIETIPCQDEAYQEVLARRVKPPANLKKPESIKAWLGENRASEAIKAMGKTSFDGARGHVCTIAWCKNGGKICVEHARTLDQERNVIRRFFEDFAPYHSEILCGHNITGFDIGFLRKRAIALGVPMPSQQSFPRDPKPWDKNVFDTMSAWAGGTGKISMDDLCDVLDIPGKRGFDGSMVAAAWLAGDHDTIAAYCRDDVWRTREILKRFLKVGFQ